ncbi:toxin-antitoxin system HicB family antitoxin [Comamonas testosteroni]|uniref:toxin-antitoxin system HicB family antitoxin n=1 Tax=Comamonas testosteroni TaxID=285 RepID=UPI0009B922C2|nr:Arc family DNA-binding protein [Comamonas testosteroni]
MDTKIGSIKPFGLRLPPELKKWVEEQAKKDRRSVNSWITLLIEQRQESQHEKQR